MSSHARALRREDFQIAVICAVGCEYDAVALAFDEIWGGDGVQLGNAPGDSNKYKIGRIGSHNVVLLLLPGMGKVNAASAAATLRLSYTGIQLAILTGICGGVPGVGTDNEVLLGDVVISKSVVQYDLGRQYPDRFALKDTIEERLGRPNKDIQSLVATSQTLHGRNVLQRRANQILERIQQKAIDDGYQDLYKRPAATEDRLFEPDYLHRHYDPTYCGCSESKACEEALQASCEELQCDFSRLMARRRLKKRKLLDEGHEIEASVAQELRVYIGRVGSGDTVMKSGLDRNRIADEHDLIAFEMEGAGVWDQIPCIVVKAVCDYADSHKNKKWQAFAAAIAASTMRALLESYPHTDRPIPPTTHFMVPHIETPDLTGFPRQHDENERKLLQLLAAEHDAYKNFNPRRVTGTCEWFFRDYRFHKWLDSAASNIIWVSAGPGCGKSVLARALVDKMRQSANPSTTTVCYFFFKDGEERRTNSYDALSALLHQLFIQSRAGSLIRRAADSYENYGTSLRTNFHQLWQILTVCVEEHNAGEVICVLDALDECSKSGREELLEALQTFYFSNQVHPASMRLKFLITSRPYDDLDMAFMKFKKSLAAETYIQFDGDDKSEEIRDEIDLVIDHKVDEFAEDFEAEDRQKISACLKAVENRTYLWLSLTFDIIYRNRSAYSRVLDVEDLLSHLPSGVFDAYEKILTRSQDKNRARCLLQIILAATRPLTLDEVNYALGLQEKEVSSHDNLKSKLWRPNIFKRTVKNLCGLFISVYDNKVSFIHQTAREFLTSPEPQNAWQGSIDIPLAHNTIFISCTRLLSLRDLSMIVQDRSRNEALPFISYAAMNWTLHYNSQDGVKRDMCRGDARELCRISRGHTPIWVEVYKEETHLPWSYLFDWTDITLASYFGLLEVVVHIINQENVDVNSQGGYFGTSIKAASAQGHSELVQTLLQHGANCEAGGGDFRTALLEAITRGHPDVVRCLLASGAQVTQEFVMAAAGCWQDGGKEVMALLLENCGDEVEITQEIVVAVAGNYRSGEEMMAMLLEKYGDKVEITQEVVMAAVRYGEKVMAFLLEKHENKVDITEEIVVAAASHRKEMMVLLLEKCGGKVKITEEIVMAAALNTFHAEEMMALLLEKRGHESKITEGVLVEVAGNDVGGKEVMALLLEKHRDSVEITEDVLWAAARNDESGDKIMALLLEKCGDEFEIIPEVVEAAAGSRHCGKQTMDLLLEKRGDEVEITQEVVMAAATNDVSGKGIMALLLEKRGDEVQITQEVFMAAAREGSSETMAFLLEKHGNAVEITAEVVEAAAGNDFNGKEVMALLLEKYGGELKITPEVVVAAAGSSEGKATLALLIEKRGSDVKVANEVLLVVARNRWGKEIMDLLLGMRGDEIQITQEVVVAVAGNVSGKEMMALLLHVRGDEIQITQDVVLAVAGNRWEGKEMMALLLETRRDEVHVTQEVVVAAEGNSRCGKQIIALLRGT